MQVLSVHEIAFTDGVAGLVWQIYVLEMPLTFTSLVAPALEQGTPLLIRGAA